MCRNISDFAEQIAGISDFLSRKNPSFISDLLLCRRIVSTSLSKSLMFVYQKFGSAFLKNFSLKFQRVPKIQLFCPFCQNLNFWHLFVARFFLYRVTQKCFEKKNSGTCSKSGQNMPSFPNMPNGLKMQLLLEIQYLFYCIYKVELQ